MICPLTALNNGVEQRFAVTHPFGICSQGSGDTVERLLRYLCKVRGRNDILQRVKRVLFRPLRSSAAVWTKIYPLTRKHKPAGVRPRSFLSE
jgi:hypothetical protein